MKMLSLANSSMCVTKHSFITYHITIFFQLKSFKYINKIKKKNYFIFYVIPFSISERYRATNLKDPLY